MQPLQLKWRRGPDMPFGMSGPDLYSLYLYWVHCTLGEDLLITTLTV